MPDLRCPACSHRGELASFRPVPEGARMPLERECPACGQVHDAAVLPTLLAPRTRPGWEPPAPGAVRD